jgi:predicted  nucleic acid-binding Zn-ribbon protein
MIDPVVVMCSCQSCGVRSFKEVLDEQENDVRRKVSPEQGEQRDVSFFLAFLIYIIRRLCNGEKIAIQSVNQTVSQSASQSASRSVGCPVR